MMSIDDIFAFNSIDKIFRGPQKQAATARSFVDGPLQAAKSLGEIPATIDQIFRGFAPSIVFDTPTLDAKDRELLRLRQQNESLTRRVACLEQRPHNLATQSGVWDEC